MSDLCDRGENVSFVDERGERRLAQADNGLIHEAGVALDLDVSQDPASFPVFDLELIAEISVNSPERTADHLGRSLGMDMPFAASRG